MFKKIRNKVNSMVATAKATVATKKAEGYVYHVYDGICRK